MKPTSGSMRAISFEMRQKRVSMTARCSRLEVAETEGVAGLPLDVQGVVVHLLHVVAA